MLSLLRLVFSRVQIRPVLRNKWYWSFMLPQFNRAPLWCGKLAQILHRNCIIVVEIKFATTCFIENPCPNFGHLALTSTLRYYTPAHDSHGTIVADGRYLCSTVQIAPRYPSHPHHGFRRLNPGERLVGAGCINLTSNMVVGGRHSHWPLWYRSPGISFLEYLVAAKILNIMIKAASLRSIADRPSPRSSISPFCW